MNKAISKWPARALNLLVVLAMVISLGVFLAPSIAKAQVPVLETTITEPMDLGNICLSQNFTVTGYVMNANGDDGGEAALHVQAYLNETLLDGGARIIEGDNPQDIGSILSGDSAQFTWKLHCDSGGALPIEVYATSNSGAYESDPVSIKVYQVPNCVLSIATYWLNPDSSTFEINADNTFGLNGTFWINAAVTNPQAQPWTNVTMVLSDDVGYYTVSCTSGNKTELADSSENHIKQVGAVNQKEVGEAWWKVKCCEAGNSTVTVTAYGNSTDPISGINSWDVLCSNDITIHQTTKPADTQIVVKIIEPTPPAVGVCVDQIFVVKANIRNLTNNKLTDLTATILFDDTLMKLFEPYGATISLDPLDAHGNHTVSWQLQCIKAGIGNITVTAHDDSYKVQSDTIEVTQASKEAQLDLELTSSQTSVCAGCLEEYKITAVVSNMGCCPATMVTAELKVTGDVATYDVAEALLRDVGDGNLGGAGGGSDSKIVEWNVTCLGEGPLTFQVTVNGRDTCTITSITPQIKSVEVQQNSLVVRIINPAGNITNTDDACIDGEVTAQDAELIQEPIQGKVVSVGQQFYIEASVQNCYADVNLSPRSSVNVTIDLPDSIALRDEPLTITIKNKNGQVEQGYPRSVPSSLTYVFDKICECCTAYVQWPVECKWRTDDPQTSILEGEAVTVTATDTNEAEQGRTDTDQDCVTIVQQCKAHLMAGMRVYLGSVSAGTFATEPTTRIAVGQTFTVVAAVTDIGQADAEDVSITLRSYGNATPKLPYTTDVHGDKLTQQTIPYIPGLSTRKAFWEFTCDGIGPVDFDISALSGTDVNKNLAIEQSNIDFTCTWTIQQVEAEWSVQIINPTQGEVINCGRDFVVKAKIINEGGSEIVGVNATIYWDEDPIPANHLGVDYDGAEFLIGPSDSIYRPVDSIAAGGYAEVTWNLLCPLGSSDISGLPNEYIKVCATATGFPNEECADVSISQYCVPVPCDPCVNVTILSPGGDTVLATGEEFIVTARVNNTTSCTAYGVFVDLYASNLCELVDIDGNDWSWTVGTVDPGDVLYHSWVLRAVKTGNTECDWGEAYIHVDAYKNSSYSYWCDDDTASPDIAPTANLVVENVKFFDMQDNEITSSKVFVCEEFQVKADVVNYGEADAWNVMATLSVTPDGSVRLAGGQAGYTEPVEGALGSHLVGWGQNGRGTVEWTVHCKQACESTITITPSGQDECGWHPVFAQDEHHWKAEYEFQSLPGRAIESQFIVPASLTIKQLEQGVDLAITKKANTISAAEEQMVTFTVVVTNNGPKDASGVVVTDTWTTGAFVTPEVIDGYPTQGSQPTFDDGFIWNVGSLVKGASATLKYTVVTDTQDEIVNTAEVTCAEGDGILENNEAEVRLNVSQFPITLKYNWNLISLPLIPEDGNITVVMSNVGDIDNVVGVYYYDASTQAWQTWAPGWASTLTRMDDGKGYWVYMWNDDTLTVYGSALNPGDEAPPAYDVYVGWNLIGFKSLSPKAASVYLNAITGLWSIMDGYSSGYYQVEGADMMEPGSGYWLAVPGPTLGTKVGTIFPGF